MSCAGRGVLWVYLKSLAHVAFSDSKPAMQEAASGAVAAAESSRIEAEQATRRSLIDRRCRAVGLLYALWAGWGESLLMGEPDELGRQPFRPFF